MPPCIGAFFHLTVKVYIIFKGGMTAIEGSLHRHKTFSTNCQRFWHEVRMVGSLHGHLHSHCKQRALASGLSFGKPVGSFYINQVEAVPFPGAVFSSLHISQFIPNLPRLRSKEVYPNASTGGILSSFFCQMLVSGIKRKPYVGAHGLCQCDVQGIRMKLPKRTLL